MDLAVIDGPNVFNMVGSTLARAYPGAEWIQAYLQRWFDFDRLVYATVGSTDLDMGIVAFHSKKALGSSPYRLSEGEADAFWGRQAISPGFSSLLVDVPRDHQETYEFKCECGKEHRVASKNEKGVDIELASYLFTTAHAWAQACIFSKDSDFTPAVRALRSRGKRIACAGVRDAKPSALVRNSHHYYDLATDFIIRDASVYALLVPGGGVDELFADFEREDGLTLGVERIEWRGEIDGQLSISVVHRSDDARQFDLVKQRLMQLRGAMHKTLAEQVEWHRANPTMQQLQFRVGPLLLAGFDRYLDSEFIASARWKQFEGSAYERSQQIRSV